MACSHCASRERDMRDELRDRGLCPHIVSSVLETVNFHTPHGCIPSHIWSIPAQGCHVRYHANDAYLDHGAWKLGVLVPHHKHYTGPCGLALMRRQPLRS